MQEGIGSPILSHQRTLLRPSVRQSSCTPARPSFHPSVFPRVLRAIYLASVCLLLICSAIDSPSQSHMSPPLLSPT
jgi:hypothetical protein